MKKHIVPISLILLSFIIGVIAYPYLPAQLPTHWNFAGEVDGYSPKLFGILFSPLFMAFMYTMFEVLPKIDPKKENYKKFQGSYAIIVYSVFALMLVIQLLMIGFGLGYNIPINNIIPALVGLLFIVIGNYMQRVKQNFFVGIKTPWALANEDVWNKTQRLGARMFVIGGIFMFITAFLSATWKTGAIIVIIGGIVVVPTVGSYIFYKQIMK